MTIALGKDDTIPFNYKIELKKKSPDLYRPREANGVKQTINYLGLYTFL